MEVFSALLALCEGNPPVTGGFTSQRPVTLSLDLFFDLRLNKRLNKQSTHRRFETQSRSLRRHRNDKNSETIPQSAEIKLTWEILVKISYYTI